MLLLFQGGQGDTGRNWGTDGYSYYEPKKKDIERMLKAWGALEDFERGPPPVSDYRKPAYQPKPKAKFEWWK
jgi:hypothetical protein